MNGNVILLFLAIGPMFGAFLSYLVGRKSKSLRDQVAAAVTACEFLFVFLLLLLVMAGNEYELTVSGICGYGLSFKLDGFRVLYGTLTALVWMLTTVFSREYMASYRNRNRYYLFSLMTGGAAMGVFLSADLFTAFIFFEIMSFTSYMMVVHTETREAMRAGHVYIAVAVIGGMVMLTGIFLLHNLTGTLSYEELLTASALVENRTALYVAGFLVFFGFGAKAGMVPLHVWMPMSYPVAPAPAAVQLTGILSKVGVFGILAVSCNLFLHDASWGFLVLMIGVVTMFLGAVIALFSINLKRTLACSSMSQIGFILVGVGMQGLLGEENALAVWGTTLHMVNHTLIKLILFLVAGVIFMNLKKVELNDIRGFGRKKPFLHIVFLMGALGIIGMPLWSGYISKTLLHESIVEYIELLAEEGMAIGLYKAIEWIFLISGGMTAAYMTKLYICIFWEKNPVHQAEYDAMRGSYLRRESAVALAVPAVLLPLFGFFPSIFMNAIATLGQSFMHSEGVEETLHYFSATNLEGAQTSLLVGACVYLLIIRPLLMTTDENGCRVYVNRWPKWLDLTELIYRPLVQVVLPFIGALASRILASLTDWTIGLLHGTILKKISIPARNKEDFEPGDMLVHTREWDMSENIASSMTFGLILYGIGMCIAILYVLTQHAW